MKPHLTDIRDMPGYNPKSNTTDQEERDVSSGQVFWTDKNRVTCRDHGAMLCVSARRDLWRCTGALGCHAGAYVEWPTTSRAITWHRSNGVFWFRVFGYGIRFADRLKHPALFSERNGLIKVLRIGKWSIRELTR